MKNTLPEFTERELQEIALAKYYVNSTNHGTAGHLSYNLICKLLVVIGELYTSSDDDHFLDMFSFEDIYVLNNLYKIVQRDFK